MVKASAVLVHDTNLTQKLCIVQPVRGQYADRLLDGLAGFRLLLRPEILRFRDQYHQFSSTAAGVLCRLLGLTAGSCALRRGY